MCRPNATHSSKSPVRIWRITNIYLEYFAGAYKPPADSIPARILEVVMPVGLETKRASPIGGLSRGMKQRLGIARAVIHDPALLVLDEPTAGLADVRSGMGVSLRFRRETLVA